MVRFSLRCFLCTALCLSVGCAVRTPHDRARVSRTLEQKAGHGAGEAAKAGDVRIPPDVSLPDGLSEDEAGKSVV